MNIKFTTLTVADVHALADRLYARGISRMNANPETSADMRVAAGVIRALSRSLAAGSFVKVDDDGGGKVEG